MGEIKLKAVKIDTGSRTEYNITTESKEINFKMNKDIGDAFIESNFLNGKATPKDKGISQWSEDETDYKDKGYIADGDLVHMIPIGTEANDWAMVFEDINSGRGISAFIGGTDRVLTGLRITVDKGVLKIYGLKKPEVDNYCWSGNGLDKDSVKRKLLDPDKNCEPISVNSKKFKSLLKFVLDKFDDPATTDAEPGTEAKDIFIDLLRKTFSDLETKIHDPENNFDDQQNYLNEYAKLYTVIKTHLGDEDRTNGLIYGLEDNLITGKTGFRNLLIKFSDNVKDQLIEKMLKEKAPLNEVLDELFKFTNSVEANLGDSKTYIKNIEIGMTLDLINKHLGSNVQLDTQLQEKITDFTNGNIDLNKLVNEIKLKAIDNIEPNKFIKSSQSQSEALSTLLTKLGLGKINDSNSRVLALKNEQTGTTLSSYLVIESKDGDRFSFRALDISKNGSAKTVFHDNQSYKQIQELMKKAHETTYATLVEMNSDRKLAVAEFAKIDFSEDFAKTIQGALLKEFKTKDIKDSKDANLIVNLLKNVTDPTVVSKALKTFFATANDDNFAKAEKNHLVAKTLGEYLNTPTDELRKKLLAPEMPKEIQRLAVNLPTDINYVPQDSLKITISQYTNSRNDAAKEFITDITNALIKLKDTPVNITNAAKTEFESSLKAVLDKVEISTQAATEIKDALNLYITGVKTDVSRESIKAKVTEILNSHLKEIKVPVAAPTTQATTNPSSAQTANTEVLNKLKRDLMAICSKGAIAKPADSSQMKDFIYLLKNGRKLHPLHLGIMRSILENYGSTVSELTDSEFTSLVNANFTTAIQASDEQAWGFSPEDMNLESIVTKVLEKEPSLRDIKVDVINYQTMFGKGFATGDLKIGSKPIDDENIKLLNDTIRDLPKNKNLSLDEIKDVIRRLVLRNSLPETDYTGVSIIDPYPKISEREKFNFGSFVQGIKEDETLAKEFEEEMKSFKGTIDRLDAIRQSKLAGLIYDKDADPRSLKILASLDPTKDNYKSRLTDIAMASRRLWMSENFLGCQRSTMNGTAVNLVEFKVEDRVIRDLIKEVGFDESVEKGRSKISNIRKHEKLLKLLTDIGYEYTLGKGKDSEQVKVNDEDSLIQFLERFQQKIHSVKGNNQEEQRKRVLDSLVGDISFCVNAELDVYQKVLNAQVDLDSDEKEILLKKVHTISDVFGKDEVVKNIPGKFEPVSVEEIMYSFTAMMQKAEAFHKKHKVKFDELETKRKEKEVKPEVRPFVPTKSATASISPQSINFDGLFLDQDLEQSNKAFNKQAEKTYINVA